MKWLLIVGFLLLFAVFLLLWIRVYIARLIRSSGVPRNSAGNVPWYAVLFLGSQFQSDWYSGPQGGESTGLSDSPDAGGFDATGFGGGDGGGFGGGDGVP